MKNGNQNQRKRSIVVRIFAIIGALTIVALGGLFLLVFILVFIVWPKDLMMTEIITSFIETSDYISYCSTSPEKKLSCMNCPDPDCEENEDAQKKDEWDKCYYDRIYPSEGCTPKPYEEILSGQHRYSNTFLDPEVFDYLNPSWKEISWDIVPASRFSANDNRAQVFIINNLPLDACVKLATYDWSQINNAVGKKPFNHYKIFYTFKKVHTQVMAVGVGNMAEEALVCGDGCIERSGDGCTGEAGTEPLIGCPNGSVKSLPLSKKDALAACKKNGQIAIKFH